MRKVKKEEKYEVRAALEIEYAEAGRKNELTCIDCKTPAFL
jgi:hypothetical protein